MIREYIGNTPIRICPVLTAICKSAVYVKEEFHNPGMSSKDRVALYMIQEALRTGQLKAGGRLVEASSGNTGLSITMLAKEMGFPTTVFISENCSEEKRNVLLYYGAELVVCANSNGPEDPQSTQYAAARFAAENEGCYFTNQYFNPVNVMAHFETTGPEIWTQTEGRISHFIAGIGTGGTISGTGRYLKAQNPNVKVIGIEPLNSIFKDYLGNGKPASENGLKPDSIEGIGRTFLPGAFDPAVVDQVFQVSAAESMDCARWYKGEANALTGFSSAAVISAIRQFHDEMGLEPDSRVVALFPDHGGRYISKLYG
ncbi:MAG TPA: cysteine synthase family protein [Sphingobacteriaceae bacterium]|nr:cysteine synthase family protein [Sphingobacteriaceae bacterium]